MGVACPSVGIHIISGLVGNGRSVDRRERGGHGGIGHVAGELELHAGTKMLEGEHHFFRSVLRSENHTGGAANQRVAHVGAVDDERVAAAG